jgi:hypothetical protein
MRTGSLASLGRQSRGLKKKGQNEKFIAIKIVIKFYETD